jgi:hypothetical protein
METGYELWIGQLFASWSSLYYVYRSYLYFDTSMLGSGATVINASLGLYVVYAPSVANQTLLTLWGGNSSAYPHEPLALSDYGKTRYNVTTDPRPFVNSTVEGSYVNMTVTSAFGLSLVNKTGDTKFCIRDLWDALGTAPTYSDSYVSFGGYGNGLSECPYLMVTYSVVGWRFIVHGAYYENGNLQGGVTNVTLYTVSGSPYGFTLDTIGGVEDVETIVCSSRPTNFVWNISDPSVGYTRTYAIQNGASFEEFWIYLPNPNEVANAYSFRVTDLVGLHDPYLEISFSVGGYSRIVSRMRVDTANINPSVCYLTQGHTYMRTIVCDEGSYSWGDWVADASLTQTLFVTPAQFPKSYVGLNISVNAIRVNDTYVQVTYNDYGLSTSDVNFTISKQELSGALTPEYTYSASGNTAVLNWYGADNASDYSCSVVASTSSGGYTWVLPAPIGGGSSAFSYLDNIFPDSPIPASQWIGLAILAFTFGAFSYATMYSGAVITVVTAAVLAYIGFLNVSSTIIAMTMCLVILLVVAHGKQYERDE